MPPSQQKDSLPHFGRVVALGGTPDLIRPGVQKVGEVPQISRLDKLPKPEIK
jgi:hypothetical protein